jgi:hypothetical protein
MPEAPLEQNGTVLTQTRKITIIQNLETDYKGAKAFFTCIPYSSDSDK